MEKPLKCQRRLGLPRYMYIKLVSVDPDPDQMASMKPSDQESHCFTENHPVYNIYLNNWNQGVYSASKICSRQQF